jgi:hypothetical protein
MPNILQFHIPRTRWRGKMRKEFVRKEETQTTDNTMSRQMEEILT